ncbi:MAG: LytTR family transcriptional regulator DNA-binding domain-containing protein [Eubacterium sp.]|nr:LytTR family transcriptional regulator DNA-binding domain-containing protein [Eubacterium sp.]
MADNVDVELILDETCAEPKVTIRAKEKTALIENLIEEIEKTVSAEPSGVPAYSDGKLEFVSQKDIMRIHTEGRQIVLDTENRYYIIKQTLTRLEDELSRDRFIRISQSEIINIYKVKRFDVSLSGTIGIEFKNGVKTYASRRYIKAIKSFLKSKEGK